MYLIVDITITRDEYLRWYQGAARSVFAVSRDGRKVQFPAQSLQPYVTHTGVKGSFAIHFDDNNRLVRVEKLQ